jgi:hypothetical protein
MSLLTTKNGLFQYAEENGGTGTNSFRELSVIETARLMALVTEVHQLLDRYLPAQSEKGISPRVLDQLFFNWLRDSSCDKPEPESVATILGSTFAFYLRDKKGMLLGVGQASEEEPTLAVTNSTLGLTLYPIWSVQKRIAAGSAGFFEPICAVVEEKLKELLH